MIIINFIRDSEVGLFSRAKRLSKAARLAQLASASFTPAASASDEEDTGSDHVASGSDSDSKKSD